MDLFLTQKDVESLTGRKQRHKQIQQLISMQLPFYLDASGWPKVLRSKIDDAPDRKESGQFDAPQSINIDKLNTIRN